MSMYFCLDNREDDCQMKTCLLMCVLESGGKTVSKLLSEKGGNVNPGVFHMGLGSTGINGNSSAAFFLLPFHLCGTRSIFSIFL